MQLFLTLISGVATAGMFLTAFLVAPVEANSGIVQKIFYFHVPAAYAMYLGWAICTVASILYLMKRRDRYNMLAKSAAEVALLFAAAVMTTGPLWGRKTWGAYWTFDPRLTSSLLFTLIVVAYVVIQTLSRGEREQRFAAALSILGAAIVPIIHFSVVKWRGQHPTVLRGGGLEGTMTFTLVFGFSVFTALLLLLVIRRYELEKSRRRLEMLTEEAAIQGLFGDAK
jgi:heme exporter protein C